MVAVKKAAEEGDRPNIPRDLDVRLQNLMKTAGTTTPTFGLVHKNSGDFVAVQQRSPSSRLEQYPLCAARTGLRMCLCHP
jgi:hypothetical protein